MTGDEENELELLHEAYLAAQREFRAHPSEEAKAAMNQAYRLYDRRHRELDPKFAEARKEANRRWREKKKLGIPTGPGAKTKLDPLDESHGG